MSMHYELPAIFGVGLLIWGVRRVIRLNRARLTEQIDTPTIEGVKVGDAVYVVGGNVIDERQITGDNDLYWFVDRGTYRTNNRRPYLKVGFPPPGIFLTRESAEASMEAGK